MRVLLTGSKGYIGGHLYRYLLRRLNPDDIMLCDIKDGLDFAGIRGQHFDCIFHLAALCSVQESFEKPELYLRENFGKVDQFIQSNTFGKFLLASTGGAMYGNARLAKEEDVEFSRLLSPYARSKFHCENIVRLLPNSTILRLANVYGYEGISERGETAVHAHFQKDDPIVVYGGQQTRDFIHVGSVCRAFIRAAFSTAAGTFNIGSEVETRIGDLAQKYSNKRSVDISLRPARLGEVENISLDCKKAKAAGLLD